MYSHIGQGFHRLSRRAKNNFVTTFNYIEENGAIGSTNILENITTFNFDERNFISFKTERYNKTPLVIKGHGAGAEVTAAGVLGDILKC